MAQQPIFTICYDLEVTVPYVFLCDYLQTKSEPKLNPISNSSQDEQLWIKYLTGYYISISGKPADINFQLHHPHRKTLCGS